MKPTQQKGETDMKKNWIGYQPKSVRKDLENLIKSLSKETQAILLKK